MNKLEEKLSVILQKSLDIAEKSGEFIVEQSPLLLQEFYKWQTVSHIMGSLLFLLTVIPFIIFLNKTNWEDYEFNQVVTIVLGSSSLFTITASVISIYKLVFITVAPKLYLIEYLVK